MSSLEQQVRGDWQAMAACAGDQGVAFYPPVSAERRKARANRERRAKAVCATCSVRSQCLAHAIARDERYGIWGGMTDKERRLAAEPAR